MHASSLENMQKCYERFLCRSPLIGNSRIRVLDVGGANVNGSYADIFSGDLVEYIAADLTPECGVDLVLDDPYHFPFESGTVDVIISGQVFEHVEFFWKLFEEMARVVRRDGFIFLIVPSSGPIHRYPVDCYRFYPDAMAALARYAGIGMIDCWQDDRGPWNDLVGVFSHDLRPDQLGEAVVVPINRYMAESAIAPQFGANTSAEVEIVAGQIPYLDVLRQIHTRLQPRCYLEIGVRRGNSLVLAQCPAIAVDPDTDLAYELPADHTLYPCRSDEFFERYAKDALGERKPDLVFIDGMHLFEFALRDFINVERLASATTLVVVDDIYPNHPHQATRKRQTRVWAGDVWKLHHCLQIHRPDLVLMPLDTQPSGLLLITGLNPANRALLSRYNPLVRQYRDMSFEQSSDAVLTRRGARCPQDPIIDSLLGHLRAARESSASRDLDHMRRLLGVFRS